MKSPERALAAAVLMLALRAPAGAQTPAALQTAGFEHFYNLELSAAQSDFEAETRLQPQSAAAWNHLSQAVLYREMLRIGALESQLYGHGDPFLETRLLPADPRAEAEFEQDNRQAVALAAAAVKRDPEDAHAHYDLAAAWALAGSEDFAVSKSYLGALSAARKARAEAERAEQLAPAWVDPRLILGVHNYIAGSLPLTAKVFSALLGYSGNKAKGREQITDVAEHGETARTDATVLLVILDRRDGLNREAEPWLEMLVQRHPRNVLYAVEWAECLEAAGDHDAARRQYTRLVELAAANAPGFDQAPLDKIWYDQGQIESIYSHWGTAVADYLKAESAPRAQPRYVQAAALAAGNAEEKLGNAAAALAQYRKCVGIDPETVAGQAARKKMP